MSSGKESVRPGSAKVNVTSTLRLQHMASRHVQITEDLPVQRRARRDSIEGEALIVEYEADVSRRQPPTVLPPTRVDDTTLGVDPVMSTWTTAAGKACVSRVKFPRTHEWKRVDRKGRHITTESIIKKALHAITPAKVKQDSALRDIPLSGESYPETTYRVTDESMKKLVEDYELVLQYLHLA